MSGNPERIVELVWTPRGSLLIAITRQAGPPARSRVFLLNAAASVASELVLMPAEVTPASAVADPSERWLAMVTHAAVAPGAHNVLNLCVLELRPGGVFRDLADLGSVERAPSAAPVAWPPSADERPDRLVFVAPAPAGPSGGGGPFDFFGALRTPASPSALFVANLEASGLEAAQPRRLGTALNTVGPVWRSPNALLSLVREDDGTLALRSVEETSGAVRDLGVRLPAGTGQGAGLAVRWDTSHGSALLLSRSSNSGSVGGPLQAWLASFTGSSQAAASR
jgi:hypothetical protein